MSNLNSAEFSQFTRLQLFSSFVPLFHPYPTQKSRENMNLSRYLNFANELCWLYANCPNLSLNFSSNSKTTWMLTIRNEIISKIDDCFKNLNPTKLSDVIQRTNVMRSSKKVKDLLSFQIFYSLTFFHQLIYSRDTSVRSTSRISDGCSLLCCKKNKTFSRTSTED